MVRPHIFCLEILFKNMTLDNIIKEMPLIMEKKTWTKLVCHLHSISRIFIDLVFVSLIVFNRTVYDRVPHLLPYQRTLLVFSVSTLWHGFYPGYYLTFAVAVLIVVATRKVSNDRYWSPVLLMGRALDGGEGRVGNWAQRVEGRVGNWTQRVDGRVGNWTQRVKGRVGNWAQRVEGGRWSIRIHGLARRNLWLCQREEISIDYQPLLLNNVFIRAWTAVLRCSFLGAERIRPSLPQHFSSNKCLLWISQMDR